MIRKDLLITGECYHVFNKSIASYRIFNVDSEYQRMVHSLRYYQFDNRDCNFANFTRFKKVEREGFYRSLGLKNAHHDKLAEIIAYCIMPTHIHLILKQLQDNGISVFMGNVLNSHARYFNRKYRRLGPLWVGRFKGVSVENDEQLWHLSRYVHLNPTTTELVRKPQDWPYSSYREYLDMVDKKERISRWEDLIETRPSEYKKFVNDQIGYQKELGIIKSLMLD